MAIGTSQAFRTQNLRLLGNLFDKNNFIGKKGYYLSSDEDGTRWIADPNETSGVFSGGILSATVGGTTFNVSAGVGQVVSRTVLPSGEVETTTNRITWNAQSNVSLTYRTTHKFSYIYIDENGTLQQQSNTFTDSQYRNQIVLGVICHINLSTINLVTNKQNVVYGDSHRLYELMSTFGPIKRSGLSVSPYGTDLRISRSSGTVLLIGSNYITDQFEPDSPTINAAAPASICRVYRNGSGDFVFDTNSGSYYTGIDPNKYDDNSGTLHTVNNNQWSVQRLFFFPSNPNDIIVYYGFGVYNSLNDAFLAIENESFYEAQITAENAVFLGYILVRGGATNLSLITDARFIQSGVSRNVIVGGGGAAGLVLDDLLDVQITNPSDSQFFVYENSSGLWKNATFNVVDPLVFTKSGTSLSLALNYASATQPGGVSIGTQTFAGSKTFKDNVIVSGNLTVNGTTVTINSSTLSVDDKNIELGSVVAIPSLSATVNIEAGDTNVIVSSTNGLIVGQALTKISGTGAFGANPIISSITSATQFTVSPVHATTGSIVFSVGGATDVTADGGGITLKGATDKTFNWIDATDSWTSSENLDLATGKVYKINNVGVLSATTLGSSVVNSSLTSVGTLTNLTVTNTITGSVSGSAGSLSTPHTFWGQTFNGTQDVSGNLTSVGNITGTGGITITAGGSNQNVVLTPSGTGYTLLNGSVGIGTATPASLLHISSTGTAKLKITADTDNVDENDLGGIEISQDGGITTSYFGHDNTNSLILGVNSTTAPNIYIGTRTDGTNFVTSADAKVTILNGGNVGIGITSPITKLHVYSPVAGTGSERTTPVDVLTLESENTTAQEFTGFGQTIVFRGSTYNNNTQRTLGKILHQINDDSVSTTRGTSLDFQLLTDATGSTLASRMYIKYDGNVGIGTNSPTQKLEVAGYAMAGESSYRTSIYGNAGGAWIAFGDTSNTASLGRIGAYNALFNINSVNGDTSFQYNGSEKMRITTVGNVGIGTTNPNDKLTILAGNYLSFQTVDLTFNSGRAARIGATTTGSGIGELIFETYKGGSGGGEKMRINSDGNVSIGNASANNKLSVLGSVSIGSGYNTAAPTNGLIVEGNVAFGLTNPSTYSSQLTIETTQSRAIMAFNTALADAGTLYGLGLGYAMSNYNSAYISFYKVGNSSTSNRLSFSLWNQNDILNINGAGNVGVGITVPTAKLHVNSATSGATLIRADGTNGTLFSVVDDLSDSLMSVNNSAGLPVLEVFADDRIVAGQYGQNDFVLVNNKVGLGTANPINKLSVIGSASIGDSTYNVAAPTNGLIIQGDVGIGTATPTAQSNYRFLQVNGPVSAVIETTVGGVRIGGFDSTSNTLYVGTIGAFPIVFRTGVDEKWRITNAGILQSSTAQTIQTATGNLTLATAAGNGHIILSNHGTGNVGIGINNPTTKFEINTPTAGYTGFTGSSTVARFNAITGAGAATALLLTNYVSDLNTDTTVDLDFAAVDANSVLGAAPHVRIGYTGYYNPGINVAPDFEARGYFRIATRTEGSGGTLTDKLTIDYLGNTLFLVGNVGVGTSTFAQKLSVTNTFSITNTAGIQYLLMGNQDSNGVDNPAIIQSANGALSFGGGTSWVGTGGTFTSTMFLNDGGCVGIGTVTPGYKLDVNGTARIANDTLTTGNLTISKSGANLYINGTNSDAEVHWQANGTSRWAMGMNVGDATENLNIYNYTTATTNFTILKDDGNVGIGIAAPTNKIDINGTARIRSISASASTATIFLTTDANGVLVSRTAAQVRSDIGAGTVTSVSGTPPIASSGGTAPTISLNDAGVTFAKIQNISQGTVIGRSASGTGVSTEIDGAGIASIISTNYVQNANNATNATNSTNVNITTDDATNSSYYLYFGANASGNTPLKASTKIRYNPNSGAFSATTKSFRIPHPTKPQHDLVYGSLESPYHGIRLTGKGKTNGNRAEIILPDYVKVLIDEETINIQLTPIKCAKILYIDDIIIDDNKFTVKYDKSWYEKSKDVEFYWDFTAERKDVPKLIVEEKI